MFSFLRTWMLAFSLLFGVLLYWGWKFFPLGTRDETSFIRLLSSLQPYLIFTMLFLSFCKSDLLNWKWRPWFIPALCVQTGGFFLSAFWGNIESPWYILAQAAMLCFIAPTATAAIVVVGKIQGDTEGVTIYTVISHLLAAVLVPIIAPLIHETNSTSLSSPTLLSIFLRVFPLLLGPLCLAYCFRCCFPQQHKTLIAFKNLAFYIWAFSLMLSITIATHHVVVAEASNSLLFGIAGISLLVCTLQFYLGRKFGATFLCSLSASQALGQKNTIFLIWVGHSFFHPLAAIAGAFYAIYHNVWNSYQLSRLTTLTMKQ